MPLSRYSKISKVFSWQTIHLWLADQDHKSSFCGFFTGDYTGAGEISVIFGRRPKRATTYAAGRQHPGVKTFRRGAGLRKQSDHLAVTGRPLLAKMRAADQQARPMLIDRLPSRAWALGFRSFSAQPGSGKTAA
jgi:hypothetical protein